MTRILFLVFLCLGLGGWAFEAPAESSTLSLYTGADTRSFPPADFGGIGTSTDLDLGLNWFTQGGIPGSVGLQWRLSRSLYRWQTTPSVEYWSASYSYPLLVPFPGGQLDLTGGLSLILQSPAENYGLALLTGANLSYQPWDFLVLSLPLELLLFPDGFQSHLELGSRWHIPGWVAGLYIAGGLHNNVSYAFDRLGFNPYLKIQIGGEI